MMIDSHCHAWDVWPYQPRVPDPHTRASGDQLLFEMDANGVDKAVIVCAQIEFNPDNNDYVSSLVHYHPDRFYQFADLDSSWSINYNTDGAGQRLRTYADYWPIRGFTHYLDGQDNGTWLRSEAGQELFATAADLGLIASIHCRPHQFASISVLATQFPEVPVLVHHMGHVIAGNEATHTMLRLRSQMAANRNVYLKLSGFTYATAHWWDYPYHDVIPLVRDAYETFGPQRLCWGSDYPVVSKSMTYRQSLEVVRMHCPFFSEQDLGWIMGGNIQKLLDDVKPG